MINARKSASRISLLSLAAVLSLDSLDAQSSRYSDLQLRASQLASQGRYVDALPVAKQAATEAMATYGAQSAYYGSAVAGMAFLEMSVGDLASAHQHYAEGISVITNALGPNSLQLINPLVNEVQLYGLMAVKAASHPVESQALYGKAETAARAIVAVAENNFAADDIALLPYLEGLATVLNAELKYPAVQQTLDRMLALEITGLPADHMQTIRTRSSLAWVLNVNGSKTEAIQQYRLALASALKTVGASDPFTASLRDQLAALEGGSSQLREVPPWEQVTAHHGFNA